MKGAADKSKAIAASGLSLLLLTAPVLAQGSPGAPPPQHGPGRMSQPMHSAPPQASRPAPIERRPPGTTALPQVSAAPPRAVQGVGGFRGKGEHLSDWMSAHSTLTPPQQQEALRNEPGFRELPQPTQQRYLDRLNQLNSMPPEKRQRWLAQTEAMERLSPEQRAAVRSATLQWGALPPEDKKIVGKAFRDLRGMPPEQRLQILNERYRNLSPQGRQALTQLMQVEPWMPPDHF